MNIIPDEMNIISDEMNIISALYKTTRLVEFL